MFEAFREIVLADFEFASTPGSRPEPVCLVAHELRSGRVTRLWRDQFGPVPPYSTGPDTLFVAYYASAELGCHRVLGWPMPARILDLFTEFRDLTNGLETVAGASLLGALAHFRLDHIAASDKDDMRELILRGGPWSESEQAAILDYCESDVLALRRLLSAMTPRLDLPRALLRGRYMAACAAIEHAGVPIDVEALKLLRANWAFIQDDLIAEIDGAYGVYEGRTFKRERFERWLVRNEIPWARLESGELNLGDDTFRQAARTWPTIAPLRELRSALADLRLNDLAVGPDGRNRVLLSAFRARTGRNQPSNSKFIFGPSVWLRSLIKPPPGHAVAYVDWAQQEFAIAGALADDANMRAAYRSGDPYLAFAKQAGAVPFDATKESHKTERELFKTCALAVQYGMGEQSLAQRIGQPAIVARNLLHAHRETYRRFWQWSDAALDHAMLHGELHTVFGWHVRVGAAPNARSLRNFCMQANGADMMRIAACLATERGVEISAPVHDAFLICAPTDRIEDDVAAMRAAMAEASRAVLGGLELGTDVSITRYPDHYSDPRGGVMWDRVWKLIRARAERRRSA